MHELFITLANGSTRVQRLQDRPVAIGRDPACELAFPDDAELSRKHMLLECEGEQWTVRDLGSTNGSRINGVPLIQRHFLRPGDRISASQVTFEFRKPQPASHTVMFEAARPDSNNPGTVAIHLRDVLAASAGAKPSAPYASKQWVSPLQALIRVGRELAVRRQLDEMFPVILDLALEAVNAERGVLLVMEGEALTEKVSRGGEFRISTTVRDRVVNGRESLLIQSIAETPGFKERKSIVLQGVRSLMAVPLQTDERVIGLLYVDALNFLRRFSNDDLNLLTVMANVAAIRIERERLALVEETQQRQAMELDQAAEIQKRHLPQCPPLWPGLEVAGLHNPCRTVGGDYHDYLQLPDGRHGIIVADVAGKGMPAALMMMTLQARVQTLIETTRSIAEFSSRLNRNMHLTCAPNRFVTVFVSAFDPATNMLSYTNAGHNPGLLLHADGGVEQLTVGGMFVGLIPLLTYQEIEIPLLEGDLLVLYTDGITEQENLAGEEFGMDRLADALRENRGRPLDALLDEVQRAVTVWTQGVPVADDQTVVLVRRRPVS